jgi:hypothetical protein
LRLATAGKFGNKIVFMPLVGTSLFGMDMIAENLIVRANQARAARLP